MGIDVMHDVGVEPNPANPRHIVTVFGVGYKMVEPS